MANSVVQSTSNGANNVTAASINLTLTGVVGGNNIVVVGACWPSIPTISDTMGLTWTRDITVSSSQDSVVAWKARVKVSGNITITVAIASGTSSVDFSAHEISSDGNPLVIRTSGSATAFSNAVSVSSVGSGTSGDIAFAAWTGSSTNSGWNSPPNTGWTTGLNNTPGPQIMNSAYLVLGSTGTVTPDWGTLASATGWAAMVIVYNQEVPAVSDNATVINTTTTGTGTYTLGAAATGYGGTSGLIDGTTYAYYVEDGLGGLEIATGVYTASGTTLSRVAFIYTTNSNAAVNWAAGTKTVTIAAIANQLKVRLNVFTASGTWTPLSTSKFFIAQVYGAGGGGGAGYGSTGSQPGGGGGSGGGYAIIRGRIADITTPVTVTVGTAGTAGASASGGADGGDGGQGGTSSFGTYAKGYGGGGSGGGVISAASGGGSGGGAGYLGSGASTGTASAGAAGSGGGVAGVAGNNGGSAAPAGNIAQTVFGGSSGGAGGAGLTNINGGDGGSAFGGGSGGGGGGGGGTGTGGAGGATNNAAGASAGSAGATSAFGNGGGGGGGSAGAAGGAGGVPGGGGGGGSNANPSGAGGAGGRGQVNVWEFA